VTRGLAFSREALRAPLTLALLVTVPAAFVLASADVLSEFAAALGGSLAGDAAGALSAGWAAAFLAGVAGFFQASSSRGADRRLALAGAGPARVAASRVAASAVLAVVAAAAAFLTLLLATGVAHPWHAAGAVLGFALIYVGVGVVIGSVVSDPLEGSLLVVFVFLLDAFAGPGMSDSPAPWAVSRTAADVLIAAGMGAASPWGDLIGLGLAVAVALAAALTVFTVSARRRG
jgi:hypothetical protein